jgi:hypothetical protein
MTAPRAGIGFLAHTGWAVAVALSGPLDAPRLAVRRRVELWEGRDAHVYHRAAEGDPRAALQIVTRAEELSRRKAREALDSLRAELGPVTADVVIVGSSARIPADLAAVLRSHPLVHSAEGALFRSALAAASAAASLQVQVVAARDLQGRAAAALRMSGPELARRIAELGRTVGSPWAKDQKDCAAAAWLALAGRHA